ncbi:hypothetical protein [Bacteroides gallinarum]|uniref:hypothetical protein n=1 Tax=Bacteroides gallinarum TaxID=376806 RepID=UPI0003691B73|nr:hypothetical protein [Bacteroides gallinarum]
MQANPQQTAPAPEQAAAQHKRHTQTAHTSSSVFHTGETRKPRNRLEPQPPAPTTGQKKRIGQKVQYDTV